MDVTTIEDTLISWLTAELSETVILGRQSDSDGQAGPRPDLPYATLFIMGMSSTGREEQRATNDEGVMTLRGDRRLTVSTSFFGANAMGRAEQAKRSLEKPTVVATLRDADISVFSKNDIQNLKGIVDTLWEPQASFDFYIGIGSEYTDDVGYIGSVGLAATYENGETLEDEFTVEE